MKQRTLLQKILLAAVAFFLLVNFWSRLKEAHERRQGALAIVNVSGVIKIDSAAPGWSGQDAEAVAKKLHELSEDKDVKAILLRINSPGGTVGAVQEISEEVARCRAQGKKVVASLGDVAASGGYYIASGCDRIVANPGTITGSIGVILEFGNLEGLFQKIGFKLQVIKSGEHKDIGSPARALTPEEKKLLQSSIDDAYAQFFEAVRTGRHLAPDRLKGLADGRIFTGRQAKEAGLVDELGDKEDAIQAAILLAKLPAKPYIISDNKRSLSALLGRVTSLVSSDGMEYRWLH